MLSFNLSGNSPIYEQLVQKIEQLVISGALDENEQLPSVRDLATHLTVNPNTVQKAYSLLEQEGVAYSVSGKGRFVTADVSALKQKRIDELLTDVDKTVSSLAALGAVREVIFEKVNKIYEEGSK